MKITKYAQSCILLELENKRILIDPGNIQFKDSLLEESWSNIDLLLITHRHQDHCYVDAIKEIVKNPKTKFYTSQAVADEYPELTPKIVKVGDIININNIKIEVVKAVHGYIPPLKGKEILENLGYIIDDGNKRTYLTSDTICFNNDYMCNIIFVPVCNHGLVMGPFEAALFAKGTGAELVIPVHYDNPKYPADLEQVKSEFKKQDLNFKILDIGESIDL